MDAVNMSQKKKKKKKKKMERDLSLHKMVYTRKI